MVEPNDTGIMNVRLKCRAEVDVLCDKEGGGNQGQLKTREHRQSALLEGSTLGVALLSLSVVAPKTKG